MQINIYFSSLDAATLPIFASVREWRNRNINVWLSRRVCNENQRYVAHIRDGVRIVDDIHVDRSVRYVEWDVETLSARQIVDEGLCALLFRNWTEDSRIIVGSGSRSKGRLVAFCDAVHRNDLPASFTKIPWLNTRDQLHEYCSRHGVFAFDLKDGRRFSSTSLKCKGARVYKELKTGFYYCMDTLHWSHYELFDRSGRHLAEVDFDGNKDTGKADARKLLDIN